jgi:hypothetical protein
MQWLPRNVRHVLGAIVAGLLVVSLACERSTPAAARKDTPVTVAPLPESVVVAKPEASLWDSTVGPALFIAGRTPREALVIAPGYTDSTALDSVQPDPALLRSLRLDLFGGGKKLRTARVGVTTPSSRSDSCRTWPSARLEMADADSTSNQNWSVAFETGRAFEMAIDSIESLPTADSARLAADVARVASALPGDTSAVFRGLPFVVNKAWRAHAPGGKTVLTAVVVRNVNQEANPRQERILLIAERDSASAASRFVPRYSERKVGLEETLETTDPIAMVLLGADRHPTVIVSRDAGNGLSYAFIERIAGQWQRRWASAYAGC